MNKPTNKHKDNLLLFISAPEIKERIREIREHINLSNEITTAYIEEKKNELLKKWHNDLAVKKKFQIEFNRATRFQRKFLGSKIEQAEVSDLDIKSYVKHVLSEGTVEEKRELLGEIRNELVLRDRRIVLERN